MQKKILFLILAGILIFPLSAFAQLVPVAPGTPAVPSLTVLIDNIVWAVWIIFTVIVVVSFVIAGVLFLTAQGAPEKLNTARSAFIWGIAGVVVGIVAFTIITIVESIFI